MFNPERRIWMLQFVKFGFVGLLNTAVDFALFALLVRLSVHYAAAQVAAYGAGMVCSYLLNNAFTFAERGQAQRTMTEGVRSRARQYRFVIWNLCMLGLSLLLLGAAAEWLGMSDMLAKAVVTIMIVALNFYGSKTWVFKADSGTESLAESKAK